MKKKVPGETVAEPDELAAERLPLEATIALSDLAGTVKDGLLSSCADVGLVVLAPVLEDEMTRRIGPKHSRIPGQQATGTAAPLGGGAGRATGEREAAERAQHRRPGSGVGRLSHVQRPGPCSSN